LRRPENPNEESCVRVRKKEKYFESEKVSGRLIGKGGA